MLPRIDGCTHLGALFRVVLPFISSWDCSRFIVVFHLVLGRVLYCIDLHLEPCIKDYSQSGFSEFTDRFQIDYPFMATGGVIAALIPVALCIVFQKGLIKGLTSGAVKG